MHTKPLSESEQDDLFNQMEKWLRGKGGIADRHFLACELENMYRMRATILQLRQALAWAGRSITEYERRTEHASRR